jgi:hypothetical protein
MARATTGSPMATLPVKSESAMPAASRETAV